MSEEQQREALYGLIDSVLAHPSTKPHIPVSTREVQLEAEIKRFKVEVCELIYRLEAILNAFEYRHELGWVAIQNSAESPF